jgi:hypothetical protein
MEEGEFRSPGRGREADPAIAGLQRCRDRQNSIRPARSKGELGDDGADRINSLSESIN